MIARLAACLLAVATVAAAPVPKHLTPPKPAKLTKELLVGSWSYSWSGMTRGWIRFEADNTYTAQHDPDGTTVYSGTYSVGEGSVTIVEWAHHANTGTVSGPNLYRFDIGLGDWPAMVGKSTGSHGFDVTEIPQANLPVKLHNRK
jgi:hypothetical protein